MSAFNAERYIAIAIDSVLAQEFGDFEFLILDDGSTDRTRATAEAFAARDSRIRVLAEQHRGLVPCLNQLLGEARAPLVARVDADDVCHPRRFARQVEFLRAHPDHGVIGCETDRIDANGALVPNVKVEWAHDHPEMVEMLAHGPPLAHPTVMMRRAVVLGVGGYRAAFAHAEDYDLWLRLSEVTKLANIPERLVSYRIHSGQVSEQYLPEQARAAAIALLAHEARKGGRPDPTDGLRTLPLDEALDAMFGPGASRFVSGRIFESVRYSLHHLRGIGWGSLMARASASPDRIVWRVAARLLLAGRLLDGVRLIAALLAASLRRMAGPA